MSSEHAVLGSDRSRVSQDRGSCSNAQARQDLCHRLIIKDNSNILVHVKAVKGGHIVFDQWQYKQEKY